MLAFVNISATQYIEKVSLFSFIYVCLPFRGPLYLMILLTYTTLNTLSIMVRIHFPTLNRLNGSKIFTLHYFREFDSRVIHFYSCLLVLVLQIKISTNTQHPAQWISPSGWMIAASSAVYHKTQNKAISLWSDCNTDIAVTKNSYFVKSLSQTTSKQHLWCSLLTAMLCWDIFPKLISLTFSLTFLRVDLLIIRLWESTKGHD